MLVDDYLLHESVDDEFLIFLVSSVQIGQREKELVALVVGDFLLRLDFHPEKFVLHGLLILFKRRNHVSHGFVYDSHLDGLQRVVQPLVDGH